MTLEAFVIIGSLCAGMMSLGAALWPTKARPRGPTSTVTITIEDAAGVRTRTVARTSRPIDEVRRTVERAVAESR